MHFPHTVSLLTATVTRVLSEDNCTPHEGFPVRHEKWLRCSKQRSHHLQPSPGVLNSPSAFSVVTSVHLWEPLCLSELPLMPWDGLLTKGPAIVRVTFTHRPHGGSWERPLSGRGLHFFLFFFCCVSSATCSGPDHTGLTPPHPLSFFLLYSVICLLRAS